MPLRLGNEIQAMPREVSFGGDVITLQTLHSICFRDQMVCRYGLVQVPPEHLPNRFRDFTSSSVELQG